ncbi:hypothetical protein GWN42_13400 [candidate division KSB1 bacterium]|nr:hypothetical protein [candidate division KSB1 bacterium]
MTIVWMDNERTNIHGKDHHAHSYSEMPLWLWRGLTYRQRVKIALSGDLLI